MNSLLDLLEQHRLIFVHLVSALSALLLGAIVLARRKGPSAHRGTMRGLTIGGRIVAGVFTGVPGRFLGSLLQRSLA